MRILAALVNAACYLPARLVAAWDAADTRLASALDPTWREEGDDDA